MSILRQIEAGSTIQLTVSKRSLNDRIDDDSGGSEQNVDDVVMMSSLTSDLVVDTESSPLHSATPRNNDCYLMCFISNILGFKRLNVSF